MDYQRRKNTYAITAQKTPFFMHKYKIDQNACFECSFERLAKDHQKCLSQQYSVYNFDDIKGMKEFCEADGFTGEGKYCVQCT